MAFVDHAEYNKLAAKMVAHERILGFLLSFHLRGLSDSQKATIEQALTEPTSMPSFGEGLDIETADDLAGLALDYADAMRSIFRRALATPDNL